MKNQLLLSKYSSLLLLLLFFNIKTCIAVTCDAWNTNIPTCQAHRPAATIPPSSYPVMCYKNITYGGVTGSTTSDTSASTTIINSDWVAAESGYITRIRIVVTTVQTTSKTNTFYVFRNVGGNTFQTVASRAIASAFDSTTAIEIFTVNPGLFIAAGNYLGVYSTSGAGAAQNLISQRPSMTGITEYRLASQHSTTVGTNAGYTSNANRAAALSFTFQTNDTTNAPAGCPGIPYCWYDFSSNECKGTSTLASCYQYYNDSTGCNNNFFSPANGCYVNYDGKCKAHCSNYTTAECIATYASTCHITYAPALPSSDVCSNVPVSYGGPICDNSIATDGCSNRLDASSCTTNVSTSTGAYCFWNGFVPPDGACFTSLSQSKLLFNCSYWTDHATPNLACTYNGCYLVAGTSTCVDNINITSDGSLNINYALSATFINPEIVANTMVFKYQTKVPLQVRISTPTKPLLAYGYYSDSKASSFLNTAGICNSNKAALTTPLPISTGLYSGTQPDLQDYFISQIKSYKSFNFSLFISKGRALDSIYNTTLVSRTNADSMVKTVDISNDNEYVIYQMQADLNALLASCGSTTPYGVTKTIQTGVTYYTIPVSYSELNILGGVSSGFSQFSVAITTSGNTIIGATSQYKQNIEIVSVQFLQYPDTDCEVGWARMKVAYQYSMFQEFQNDIFVGAVRMEDITTKNSSNCYGDFTSGLELITPCVDKICYTKFDRMSHCRQLTAAGDAFALCSRAPADFLAEADDNNINILTADAKHDIYIASSRCPYTDLISETPFAGCTDISINTNIDPITGTKNLGDPVSITITVSAVYPTVAYQAPAIDVQFGLLRDPLTFIIDNGFVSNNITQAGQYNISAGFVSNKYTPIFTDSLLTIGQRVANADIRNVYGLNFNVQTGGITFYFIGLNATLNSIYNSPKLDWTIHLSPYATYSPRLTPDTNNLCPVCIGVIGCDCFAIDVYRIFTKASELALVTSTSFAISINWDLILPSSISPVVGFSGPFSTPKTNFDGSTLYVFTLLQSNTTILTPQVDDSTVDVMVYIFVSATSLVAVCFIYYVLSKYLCAGKYHKLKTSV